MNEKEILERVQCQISEFDNKASILLSVVGIVFALSLSFLDVFHSDFFTKQSITFHNWYYVLFVMFILSAIVSIASLVFVITPRKGPNGKKYPNYYYDIAGMTEEDFLSRLSKSAGEVYTHKEDLIGQILINSKICKKKHIAILIGAYSLIPFMGLIVGLTIMIMVG